MQLKKDPFVLALAAICVIAMTAGLVTSRITWPEMLMGLGLLGLPSIFGKDKEPPT